MRTSNNQNGYRGKRVAGELRLVVENAEEVVDTKTAKKVMCDHNLKKRIDPVPLKEQDDGSLLPEKTLDRMLHLTDTAALVRLIQADLVRKAKVEFAAVMTELNESRNRDESTQLN